MGTALAWTDQADLTGGDFVIEAYLDAMHQNQEALISQPVAYNFDEVNEAGATYVTKVSQEIYVPPAVGTLQGDVVLVVRYNAWVDADTGKIRARLGTGTWVESGDITVTSEGTYIGLTLPSVDVKAAADSLIAVETQLKMVSGTGPVRVKYNGGGTHYERQP
jgi:hypothetical protein